MLGGYKEQYDRVIRLLGRVLDQDRPSEEYDDDLWSFFQHCYHLKDWIKNDPAVPEGVRKSVERDLGQYLSLEICGDLANRTKHRVQTRHVRVGAAPKSRNVTLTVSAPLRAHAQVGGASITDEYGTVRMASSVSHIIELADGSEHVAQKVAKNAVDDWKTLLMQYKLL